VTVAISDNPSKSGCRKPLTACAVITALVIAVVVGLLIYLFRMPVIVNMRACQSKMIEINDALRRYYDVNGEYPPDLRTLEKDYIKDKSVLRCPLDKSPGNAPSYVYHRPGRNAPGDFVVLECSLHRLARNEPVIKLVLLKNGRPTVERLQLRKP
jgi:hypothetical protein